MYKVSTRKIINKYNKTSIEQIQVYNNFNISTEGYNI